MELTPQTFTEELREALKTFEFHIVCLEKTPEQCQASLLSLLQKAITAYKTRAPGLRHGIALDRHITVILSQTESDRPLCGIYFNLSSPHHSAVKDKQGTQTED